MSNESEFTNQFNKNGYIVIKGMLNPWMIDFFRTYMVNLLKSGGMDSGDEQVEESFCKYGDLTFDTLLQKITPIVSSIIDVDLIPTYSYVRIYRKGAELLPHIDRPECEFSATVSLGGIQEALWPIWMKKDSNDAEMLPLYEGDMCIYKGDEVYHWRDKFEGESQYQLFLHWVDNNGKYAENKYDSRPALGLPFNTRK